IGPCDCSPRCPKTRQSSLDPPAGAMPDRATRAQSGGHPRNHAQWHARSCGHVPGPELRCGEPACRASLGAFHFVAATRVLACLHHTPVDYLLVKDSYIYAKLGNWLGGDQKIIEWKSSGRCGADPLSAPVPLDRPSESGPKR